MIKNRDNIYKLVELLGYIIEVYRDGVFVGKYRYIDGKVTKID